MRECVEAGVDLPMHMLALYQDDAIFKMVLQKKSPVMMTINDLVGLEAADNKITGGKISRVGMGEQSLRKLLAAGVPLPFCPHVVVARDNQSGHGHPDRPLCHERMTRGIMQSEAVMQVHLEIPEDLAKQLAPTPGDLTRAAIEAIALEGVRSGKLTVSQGRRLLGLESRYEMDGFLKAHGVFLDLTLDDVRRDSDTALAFSK